MKLSCVILLVSALVAVSALPKLPGAGMQEAVLEDTFYNRILNSMYFLHTHVTREDIRLTRIDAQKIPGMIVKYTFEVVSNGESCEVIVNGMRQDVAASISKDTCTQHIPKPEEEDWTKRSPVNARALPKLPGAGMQEADLQDAFYNRVLNSMYFLHTHVTREDIRLTKIEAQKIPGMIVKYTFEVVSDGESCEVIVDGMRQDVAASITKDTCTQHIPKPEDEDWTRRDVPMPGGFVPQDTNDSEFLQVLEEVYFTSNSVVKAEQLEIRRIETQVVAGINIRYTFNVMGSNAICQILINRHWGGEKTVLSDSCEEAVGLKKRDIVNSGSWLRQSKKDEEFLQTLNEVYFEDSSVEADQVELEMIESQVLNAGGINLRYTFSVSSENTFSGSSEKCQIVIHTDLAGDDKMIVSDTCSPVVNYPI